MRRTFVVSVFSFVSRGLRFSLDDGPVYSRRVYLEVTRSGVCFDSPHRPYLCTVPNPHLNPPSSSLRRESYEKFYTFFIFTFTFYFVRTLEVL